MENNRECYHCDGHPELVSAYFPLHGYTADDVPPTVAPGLGALRQGHGRPPGRVRPAGLPADEMRELDTRPTGFMVSHAPLDGAGKSFNANGEAVCRKLMGSIATDRFGDLHLHVQPNAWFHMLADHAVVFSVLPLAPDKTFLRTTWLVHPDAVEGVDYDLATLTKVWNATNAQDSAFVARTQQGVRTPATSRDRTRRSRGTSTPSSTGTSPGSALTCPSQTPNQ